MQHAVNTNEIMYSFRLFFPSSDDVSKVYANYVKASNPRVCRYGNPTGTVELRMLSNVERDGRRYRCYRPANEDESDSGNSQVMVFGLRNEVSQEQLREVLDRNDLSTTSITIQQENGTFAEVEFADPSIAEAAVARFGREG